MKNIQVFEGNQKNSSKKEELENGLGRGESNSIALPRPQENQTQDTRGEFILEKSGDHFFLWAGRKTVNLSECSYFFNQIFEDREVCVIWGQREATWGDLLRIQKEWHCQVFLRFTGENKKE